MPTLLGGQHSLQHVYEEKTPWYYVEVPETDMPEVVDAHDGFEETECSAGAAVDHELEDMMESLYPKNDPQQDLRCYRCASSEPPYS